jgi:hypothetical protein
MEVDFREGRRMNLITITDEMLKSAHIEESDKKILDKLRFNKNIINVESELIRELSPVGLNYVFSEIFKQACKGTYRKSLIRLNNKLTKVKESGLMNEDYINGWDDAIFDLNKVYLGSLQ